MSVSPIPGGASGIPPAAAPARIQQDGAAGFQNALGKLLNYANANQHQADQAVQQLATGEAENVHDVVLSVAKADLSLRLVMEVRNRLVEAYQEIMRMQM